jgi:hypothetical protein
MSPSELVEQWTLRVHRVQLAHYESARRFERLHLWPGVPGDRAQHNCRHGCVCFLVEDCRAFLQVVIGFLSVTAAVLTGLQTFLKYAEFAERQ